MSRDPGSVPSFRIHKATGQGYVELAGKRIYLGRAELPETRQKYHAKVAEWLASGRSLPVAPQLISVTELGNAFLKHALIYYRHADGSLTNEIRMIKDALRILIDLYGHLRAADFTPLSLQALRQEMIRRNWCRTNINRQVNRIRHVFKWGVANNMVPPSVFHGLQAVSGLKRGRSEARESEPVKPVPEAIVKATLPFLSRHLQAMVNLQLLTGMRPGEVCAMRGCDLDTTGRLWLYRPHQHKTLHHGHERIVYIGPQARQILEQFLKPDLQAYLFRPCDAIAERRQMLRATRKTPMSCGNVPGSNVQKHPRKVPSEFYTTSSYARAIARACEQAFEMPKELKHWYGERPQPDDSKEVLAAKAQERRERAARRSAWNTLHVWHPHQLRHTSATNLRKTYGLEAAQVILGHKTLTVTQVYAEKNIEAAQKIMAEVG